MSDEAYRRGSACGYLVMADDGVDFVANFYVSMTHFLIEARGRRLLKKKEAGVVAALSGGDAPGHVRAYGCGARATAPS